MINARTGGPLDRDHVHVRMVGLQEIDREREREKSKHGSVSVSTKDDG